MEKIIVIMIGSDSEARLASLLRMIHEQLPFMVVPAEQDDFNSSEAMLRQMHHHLMESPVVMASDFKVKNDEDQLLEFSERMAHHKICVFPFSNEDVLMNESILDQLKKEQFLITANPYNISREEFIDILIEENFSFHDKRRINYWKWRKIPRIDKGWQKNPVWRRRCRSNP